MPLCNMCAKEVRYGEEFRFVIICNHCGCEETIRLCHKCAFKLKSDLEQYWEKMRKKA